MKQTNLGEFRKLIAQYLDNRISSADEEKLFNKYDELQTTNTEWNEEVLGRKELVRAVLLQRISRSLEKSDNKKTNFAWLKIAASVLVLLSLGLAFYFKSTKAISTPYKGATLTLFNGESIALDNIKVGEQLKGSGYLIKKHANNYISYIGTDKTGDLATFNEIVLPRAVNYKLQLVDGTVVTLNTSSSLKFPNQFYKNSRVVTLNGEAYFEVSKHLSKDFRVVTGAQTVRVLGTRFNVKAYAQEQKSTTLIEGKVQLIFSPQLQKSAVTLKPGQQAILNDKLLMVKEVDTSSALAWLDGFFEFRNENIKTIMAELQKYYDVDVDYIGDCGEINLSGRISRSKKIGEIVKILNMTGGVNLNLKGRRIVVEQFN